MLHSRAGLLAKTFLLSAAMFCMAVTSFAHRVELYNTSGCTSGSTLTVSAVVTYAPSSTYYNWQYKDNSGIWKFFTASSTINGTAFTVSGYQSGPAANNSGTLSIANATTVLDGVQVRVLMSENVRPVNASASTQIWGGDDEGLSEVKMFRLHVYASATDCGGTTPGCSGNLLSGSSYYGGFESKVYNASAVTFTDNNFASGAGSTDYSDGAGTSATPGTSGLGSYFVWNNPYTANNNNAKFAPHTGNYQMIVQAAANTQKRTWYKTVSVTPNSIYNFSVWVARTQGSNAFNIKLTANGTDIKTSAVSTSIGVWNQVAASYTVPAGVTSMVIAVSDVSTSAARYYSIDDICFAKVANAASIGDKVWMDNDADGIQDAGEPGISGVSVQLKNAAGTVIATTTTNASGIYSFTGLAAGTYTVVFPLTVTNGTLTTQNAGSDDAVDSDPSVTTGATGTYTLTAGQSNTTVDAGYLPTNLKLGDKVFYDTNNNGVDNSENGIANVTVRLYKDDNNDNVADGAAIATTTTNASGNYSFSNLRPGNYIVGAVAPQGYMSSAVNGGDPDNNTDKDDNGQVAASGNEVRGLAITLTGGAENDGTTTTSNYNATYDFGFLPDCSCTTSSSNLLTNASFENGNTGWSITGGGSLTTGTGYIACGSKNGFNNSAGNGTASKLYQDVTLPAGSVISFNGFAGTHTAGISCSPTLSLIFLNSAGGVISQVNQAVTRDVDVNNSQLENYTISATAPAGTVKVRVQSSITCNTMKVDAFCLTAVIPSFTLGNNVWHDLNNDGIKDANEAPLAGVTVKLYDGAGTYLNKSTVTDAAGAYQFTGLTAGNYIVGITTPAGYTKGDVASTSVTTDNQNDGTTIVGAEIRTGSFSLTGSTNNIDFGLKGNGGLGDFVWNDKNGNGIQDASEPGIPNDLVILTYPDGVTNKTTTTNAAGAYSFTDLAPGNYKVQFTTPDGWRATKSNVGSDDTKDSDPVDGIVASATVVANAVNNTVDAGFYVPVKVGNYVWYDKNDNGIQDANEAGIQGVSMKIYADDDADNIPDGAALATTTTNAAGNYTFANLAPGKYIVALTIPAGYQMGFTTASSLNPDNDNNTDNNGITIIGTEVRSNFITLVSGDEPLAAVDGDNGYGNLTLDFALKGNAAIGNYVWNDLNGNGLQDGNEPGIAGVTVTLTFADGSTKTTVTNQAGIYNFTGLVPGTYSVRFTTPAGNYIPTASNVNANGSDLIDSDPVNGVVNNITLAAGEINNSIDAGFRHLINLSGNVWHDANGMTDNEVNRTSPNPIPNSLIMYLVDDNTGTVIDAYVIGDDGTYMFENVNTNTVYRLVLSTFLVDPGQQAPNAMLPTGWLNTGENLGAGPNSGSDGTADGILYIETENTDVINANFGIRLGNGEIIVG